MSDFGDALLIILWVMGVVIVEGFWWTLFTIIMFPYAWYVSIRYLLNYFGAL